MLTQQRNAADNAAAAAARRVESAGLAPIFHDHIHEKLVPCATHACLTIVHYQAHNHQNHGVIRPVTCTA